MKAMIAVAASALIGASMAFGANPMPNMSRQDEVAHSGASVMPFDLMRTTHYFDDTPSGGVETITANDERDARQAALIRAHLAAEAKRFSHGDFSDPAKIHGADMPGLAELTSAGTKLHVKYKKLPAGAKSLPTRAEIARWPRLSTLGLRPSGPTTRPTPICTNRRPEAPRSVSRRKVEHRSK